MLIIRVQNNTCLNRFGGRGIFVTKFIELVSHPSSRRISLSLLNSKENMLFC